MSGFLEFIIGEDAPPGPGSVVAGLAVFAAAYMIAVSFLRIRAKILKRPDEGAPAKAEQIASFAVVFVFVGIPFLAVAFGFSFFILNFVGIVVFKKQHYWPIIVPGWLGVLALIIRMVLSSTSDKTEPPPAKDGEK